MRALTHASYAAEHPSAEAQDPLAFVGDAALGLVVAEHLLHAEPAASVGRLTPRRAALVADEAIARWAATLDLGPLPCGGPAGRMVVRAEAGRPPTRRGEPANGSHDA